MGELEWLARGKYNRDFSVDFLGLVKSFGGNDPRMVVAIGALAGSVKNGL
jgi:hypothetical protein